MSELDMLNTVRAVIETNSPESIDEILDKLEDTNRTEVYRGLLGDYSEVELNKLPLFKLCKRLGLNDAMNGPVCIRKIICRIVLDLGEPLNSSYTVENLKKFIKDDIEEMNINTVAEDAYCIVKYWTPNDYYQFSDIIVWLLDYQNDDYKFYFNAEIIYKKIPSHCLSDLNFVTPIIKAESIFQFYSLIELLSDDIKERIEE